MKRKRTPDIQEEIELLQETLVAKVVDLLHHRKKAT